MWGIGSGSSSQDQVQSYVDMMGLTFPVLYDERDEVNQQYALEIAVNAAAYPQDWVIGTDGLIVYGNNRFELDELILAIDRELAE